MPPEPPPDGVTYVPFASSRGRDYWLHPSGVRLLRDGWLRIHGPVLAAGREPLPGASRASPCRTVDEGGAELEADSEPFQGA
eukprot:6365260-Pyramimonas_sp.AAC.1